MQNAKITYIVPVLGTISTFGLDPGGEGGGSTIGGTSSGTGAGTMDPGIDGPEIMD